MYWVWDDSTVYQNIDTQFYNLKNMNNLIFYVG